MGHCSYDLRSKDGIDYQGQRACGGAPSPTRLHLPEKLTRRPRGERLALLAMLLSA